MRDKMNNVSETDVWADKTHAEVFDYLHKMPKHIVKRHYETFNEGRLLKKYKEKIEGNKFFEIGCATGELYRYITTYMKEFTYHGFDISVPAINRATSKYPSDYFHILENGFDDIIEKHGQPDVVWCRDVILHQDKPYKFLNNVIKLAKNTSIVRLRTRDSGETVFDTDLSCQLHWDKYWAPYIVLNIDEMISKIKENKDVNKIIISRSYEILGGHNYRFLPKELYFTSAGTAETAVFIQKGDRVDGEVVVVYDDNQDRPKLGIIERVIRKTSLFFM